MTIALAGVTPTAAEDEEHSACPPTLRVWRSHGNAEPGGQWQADVLEINGDIAILREVVIRFGDGTLPPDEAVGSIRRRCSSLMRFAPARSASWARSYVPSAVI